MVDSNYLNDFHFFSDFALYYNNLNTKSQGRGSFAEYNSIPSSHMNFIKSCTRNCLESDINAACVKLRTKIYEPSIKTSK